ncbi:diguanylate cyclase [Clostridium bowmanii]|uniref:sensor domain-containing diguanylate cyclase n=1 Tax=Clostridium bowmanii TaxID=132925 RepID=UPI001C0C4713|nr:diguanylate cyclase [Clostridium bowmanii]MBU3188523.1 diguanylate cyclase [Clostridium bowmanii]MCA1072907.1 diguanylate cyclase [Clostridium bowmanii]
MGYDHNDNTVSFLREIYIEIDDNELITFISGNCSNLLGYTMPDLLDKSIRDILSTLPNKSISVANLKSSVITKDNKIIPVDLAGSPRVDDKKNIVGYRLSLIDISWYHKSDSHEKMTSQMFERSRDLIYRVELIPAFKFTYLSQSVKRILGYSAEENLIDSTLIFNIVHPDDSNILIRKMNNDLDFSKPIPCRFQHKDGHYVWLDDYCTPIYDENGVLVAQEGFNRDVTDKKLLEKKLERLSYYDSLTGAYNRHYLEKEIHILDTEKDLPIGILFCDLDNLKVTNDNIGHEFGDKLIVNAFNILKSSFTDNSVICRSGGDEFVVIIKDTSLIKVKLLFLFICESIKQQNKRNPKHKVEVSIGYSFSETSLGVTRQLINTADKNMYKDKQRKKSGTSNHFQIKMPNS